MTRYLVAPAAEIPVGPAKIVRAGGEAIGVFQLAGGGWRAYRNLCPHAGAPVCEGTVRDGPRPVLRCPWHDWDFDLASGAWLRDARASRSATSLSPERPSVRPSRIERTML